jgi:hypothetical protein
VAVVALWPPFFRRAIEPPTAFSPIDWHAHEIDLEHIGA